MQTGQWICSVLSHQGTCYIRWVFVASWEAYRDALAEWFPGTPWEPSHHRVWFHVGHLTNLKERVETYIKTLLGNAGAWGDWRCGYYICNEIIQADTLRPKLFQELHAIVLDEVNADESGETLDAPHAYTHQCRMAYQYKPVEDTEAYDPEALLDSIHEAPLELVVESSGCLQDPWDAEYPIVWKRETVKDLLVLAQRMNIPARSGDASNAGSSDAGVASGADASFWKVDDCFNLRSRSMKAVVKEHDIIRLFQWMGLNPAHLTGLREIMSGAGGATGTWEDYFVSPLGSANDPMQPIEGYDRSGRLYFDFKHWAENDDWIKEWRGLGTPPKKLATEPAPERVRDATAEEIRTATPKKMVVRLYKNKITGAVQTMVKEPMVLLPEITLLYESPEYTEHEAAWLRLSFDSAPHTNQPTTLQTSLYEMKLAALGVDVSRLGWDGGKVMIGKESVPELTARSVLQHVIQHANLTPTTVWTPSQELLEVFMGAIKKLNEAHPGLQLQCQRNVLAVLLADLVPKRRFMTGQMFQMKKPSVADIEQALKTLPIPEPDLVSVKVGA